MNKSPELNLDDLKLIQRFNTILNTLDELLYHIRPKFELYFNSPFTHPLNSDKKPIKNKGEILNQIINYNRHAIWRHILNHGQVIVSFDFGNKETPPLLKIYSWIYKDGRNYKEIKKLVNTDTISQRLDDENSNLIIKDGDWFGFGYEKPLEDFIIQNDPFNEIDQWCNLQLKNLYQFMLKTKIENNIPWEINQREL